MLLVEGAYEKTTSLISKLVVPLRAALSSNIETLDNFTIVMLLSGLVKEKLNPYLNLLLQQINKKSLVK